jgi:uncharacterized membrane protein YbhN (UPF0104 family)
MVRIYYAMKGNHGRRTEIATIILLDRLFGIFALLMLPLLIAPLVPQLSQPPKLLPSLLLCAAAGAVAILAGLVICFAARLTERSPLLRILQNLPLGNGVTRVYDTVHAYRRNVGTLAAVIAISITVHSLLVSVMLLLVQVTSAQHATWLMAVVVPFGLLANSIPLTPGGIGVGEIAFDKAFELAGFTGGIEALLSWRALTTVIDLLGLIFYLRGRQETVSSEVSLVSPDVVK